MTRTQAMVASRPPRIGWVALLACVVSLNVFAADPAPTKKPAARAATKSEAAPAATTKDPLPLDTTTIKGQQGLPKVLNIVPWKRPGGGDLPGRPAVSLVDDALAPLDRGEMRRQLRYEDDLQAAAGTPATATNETK